MNSDHLTWEAILNELEPGGERSESFSAHVGSCPDCLELVARAENLLSRLEAGRLPEPPETLNETVLGRILAGQERADFLREVWANVVQRLGQGVDMLTATLVADSLTPSHAVRGAGGKDPRLMLFETETHSVSLSVTGDPSSKTGIMGQLTPRRSGTLKEGGRVFLKSDEFEGEESLSIHGEFTFERAPKADFTLLLALRDQAIVVGPVGVVSPDSENE